MSDREWSDGKTRWLTGVEAEVFASTQSLKRAISMMKARQLETDCDVDEAEWLNTDIDRLSQLVEKEQGRLEGAHEGGEVVAKRKKPLAVRRSKISAGNYRVTRQDGEIFIIQKGVVAKGWTIESQRTFAIDSAVDLGQANYMITNCIGKVCAEVFHK